MHETEYMIPKRDHSATSRSDVSGQTRCYLIAIATFRRPEGLLRLLDSLAQQETGHLLKVLVADNDGDQQQGMAVVREIAADYRWPIQAVVVRERGISSVRNHLMQAMIEDPEVDGLVFLDDDQTIVRGWLEALINMQRQTGADVVGGFKEPDFQQEAEGWARNSYIYRSEPRPDGLVDLVYGTGGTMIQKSVTRFVDAPFFDLAFSATGGGDTEFFDRIRKRGATFALTSAAVNYETMVAERMTIKWARMRAFRIGANQTRIAMLHGERKHALRSILKAFPAVAVGLARLPFCIWNRDSRNRNTIFLYRNLGRISAISGFRYREYQKTYGS